MTSNERKRIVQLIETLRDMVECSEATLYLAVSLVDHTLSNLLRLSLAPPDKVILAVTCLLLSVKIEEHSK